jgi:hypothetical protein
MSCILIFGFQLFRGMWCYCLQGRSKIVAFWIFTLCSLISSYQYFEGTFCLLVVIYQTTTGYYNLEYNDINHHILMGFLEFGPPCFMCYYSPEMNLIGEVLERDKMEQMSQSPTLKIPN